MSSPPRDFADNVTPPSVFLQKAGAFVPGKILALIQGTPLSGSNIGGTSCGEANAVFSDSSTTPISSASPPYVGVFKTAGAAGLATFNAVDAQRPWSLEILNAGGTVIVECWTVQFTLASSPS